MIGCKTREVSDVHRVVTDVPMDENDVESVHDEGDVSLEDDGGQPIEDVMPGHKSGSKERRLTKLKASFAKMEQDHSRLQEQHAVLEEKRELMTKKYLSLKRKYNAIMTGVDEEEGEMEQPGGVTGGCTSCFTVVSDVMSILSKRKLLRSEFTCPM